MSTVLSDAAKKMMFDVVHEVIPVVREILLSHSKRCLAFLIHLPNLSSKDAPHHRRTRCRVTRAILGQSGEFNEELSLILLMVCKMSVQLETMGGREVIKKVALVELRK